MGDKPRGTVTPLSESISVQDAENVAKKVAEAIDSQMQQLRTLQGFADENHSLTKLLLELPDLVSYNIMVPFGDAAFMPGRLIHTNEFLVLLGEGYYAERSAKQAAEIMTRRSNFISTKIDALKEQIKDLEAEASFVKETAAEAAGGLVEIREDYTELSLQPSLETAKTNDDMANITSTEDNKDMDSDDEHAQIMARLAELEMAEEAAEDEEEDDDSDDTHTDFRAAFRRPNLGDLDETDDEDDDEDDEEDDDEDEEDEDEDNEEVDLDDRTTANTFLNRSAVRLSEVGNQDMREEFQSSILQSQVQASGPGTQTMNFPAAGPSGQRRVKFPELDDSPKPSLSEPLPPKDIKASAAQKRAFTGKVTERNTELLPPVAPVVAPEAPSNRPVSKFKQRKG